MFYQFFQSKNNPSLSRLSAVRTTERTYDALQVSANVYNNHERIITEPSTNDGYLIKKQTFCSRHQKNKIYIFIHNIQNTFKEEIEKIKEESKIKLIDPQIHIQDMLSNTKEDLEFIINKLRKILINKSKRSISVDIIQEINHFIIKFKNIDIKILITLTLAKIAKYYNLLYYSISLAKNAKRLSDSESLLKYKLKAYSILSQCFLKLRLKQAKIYITKYLMCSWKLGQVNSEFKGYEQLGKYYYYEGNIKMAQLFHNRMLNGESLKFDSSLKRLAISKFEQGSIGKNKKDNHIIDENNLDISSDDEPFEIIFNQDSNDVKLNTNTIMNSQRKKNRLLNFSIRSQPLFNKTNIKKSQQEIKNANLYIRSPKQQNVNSLFTEQGNLDLQKLKNLPHSHLKLGELKTPVMLNHLSPNRCLANYQSLELNKSPQSNRKAEEVELLFDVGDIHKMSKILNKIITILTKIDEWLYMQNELQ
ncbi:unnamed protein product [Paramecium pentaurelia]|uniref:Uncharacterized protein n=1 Tax=Paramecium pentaurelia TaxID=43138 RepID=A0A8S1VXH4_9CILI|nr:unnamed protein product [Paramecium pentaurelia]